MTYTKPQDGQWVQPIKRGYKLRCCDCGLVHRMDFRIVKGRVQFMAFRHARSTADFRRRNGIVVKQTWKKA